MAGMISQLLEILNEQADRYEELQGLSLEKKDAVIANDIEALQKITYLENVLVSQHQKLEKKRLAVMKDIAIVLNKKEAELTLAVLIDAMQGQAEHAALKEAGARIRRILHELADINAHNTSLIQNALEYTDYSLNVLRSAAGGDRAFYNARGEQLTSTTGYFDAKH